MRVLIFLLIAIIPTCNKKGIVKLDGSQSYSNCPIVTWKWYQISGPQRIIFDSTSSSVTTVKYNKPKKGTYIIALSITDSLKKSDTQTATYKIK